MRRAVGNNEPQLLCEFFDQCDIMRVKSISYGTEVVPMHPNCPKTVVLKINRFVVVLAALIFLTGGAALFNAQSSDATSVAPHGIVLIGATNEGTNGASHGPATGILDISAAPCVGAATVKVYEALPSRITLLHGTKVVARWEIYGMQRIAWVEPVGTYLVHSNQSGAKRNVTIVVLSAHPAKANLVPSCK